MGISRNQILEKRKRLEKQKEKDKQQLKVIQERIKKVNQTIIEEAKKEEQERKRIAGEFVLEKIKKDSSFKVWFDGEINAYLKNDYEKNLFGLLISKKQEATHESASL